MNCAWWGCALARTATRLKRGTRARISVTIPCLFRRRVFPAAYAAAEHLRRRVMLMRRRTPTSLGGWKNTTCPRTVKHVVTQRPQREAHGSLGQDIPCSKSCPEDSEQNCMLPTPAPATAPSAPSRAPWRFPPLQHPCLVYNNCHS